MINCEVGKVDAVAQALGDVNGVAEVYSVTGQYDIIALVRVKEYDSLAKVVSEKTAGLTGIAKTDTHLASRSYSKQDMEKMWAEFIAE